MSDLVSGSLVNRMFDVLWMMNVVNVDIYRHGMLVMRVDMELMGMMAVVESVMVSMAEWKADSMDGMGVSLYRNVMLSVSVRKWWGDMALFKIVSIGPEIPGEVSISAFQFSANIFVGLFAVFDGFVIILT